MFEDDADVNLDELTFDTFILPTAIDEEFSQPFRDSSAVEELELWRGSVESPRNIRTDDVSCNSSIVDASWRCPTKSPKNKRTEDISCNSSIIDADLLTSPPRLVLNDVDRSPLSITMSPQIYNNISRSPSIITSQPLATPQCLNRKNVRLNEDVLESPWQCPARKNVDISRSPRQPLSPKNTIRNSSFFDGRHNNYSPSNERCNSSIFEGRSSIDENVVASPPTFNNASERAGILQRSAKKRIRKFPGPAGVVAVEPTPDESDEANPFETTQEFTLSQGPSAVADLLAGTAWSRLVSDLRLTDNGTRLLTTYTIDWIKRRANADRLVNDKVPFLAAVMSGVEFKLSKSSGSVRLVDPTGTLCATVQHDLHARHVDDFVDGAALILVHFGVLTVGDCGAHNASVTSDTLAAIYQPDGHVTNLGNAELLRLLDGPIEDVPQRRPAQSAVSKIVTSSTYVAVAPKPQEVAKWSCEVQPRRNCEVPKSCTVAPSRNVTEAPTKVAKRSSEVQPKRNCEVPQSKLKRFKFTSRLKSTEPTQTSSAEHSQILEDVLDGVDTDSFFEDF